ncbi:MAG: lipid A biosynthesis acyltransferase [Betaproteobacteria bacterium]|nr:lipid A biosynthesis acyltransferase [Betaproteobacteria bacterium]
MSRLVFALMWLVHWLPMWAIAAVGNLAGTVAFWLIPERRRVTRINLAKCFPQMPAAERERLARAHFRAFMRSFVEHALLWWASRDRIMRLVRLEGLEHLRAAAGHPVILVAPHFVGLDAAYTRLGCEIEIAGLYAHQKNPVYDRLLLRGRTRFGLSQAIPRQDGVRAVIASIRSGRPFYYAPDLDFGRKDAVFVPFFGVTAATITGVSRLAKLTRAKVLPCVARMLPGGGGYVVTILPAWENFPTDDFTADTRRVNAFIEEQAQSMPEQYYWVHKRFKTRPHGEASPYE